MLLDEAGFETMHTQDLTEAATLLDAAWLEKLRHALGMKSLLPAPTELEVGRIVVQLVFEGIWRKKMSFNEAYAITPYLEFGKMCIFGKRGKHMGLVQPLALAGIKRVALAFARDSPTAEKLLARSQQEAIEFNRRQLSATFGNFSQLIPTIQTPVRIQLAIRPEGVA